MAPSRGRTAAEGEAPELDVILEAYVLLLEAYVEPPPPPRLVAAAWRGVRQRLDSASAAEGGSADGQPESPTPGDAEAAWLWFEQRYAAVARARQGGGPQREPPLHQAAIQAMAAALGDCHTRFVPSFAQEADAIRRGERFSGIGLTPGVEPEGPPLVLEVAAASPAAAAGVLPGDELLAVDGVPAAGLSTAALAGLLRGPVGSAVRLALRRPGRAQPPFDLAVIRGPVLVPPVEGRVEALATGTRAGILTLRGFPQALPEGLDAAMATLRADGARAWVLDLRNNGGGDLAALAAAASYWFPPGTPLAYEVQREGARQAFASGGGRYDAALAATPVVALVNRNTSSAAELLAALLQDRGLAPVVGERTAGCFGTARLARLSDGSGLWVTTGRLLTGSERDLRGSGVQPDDVVGITAAQIAAGADPQIDRALEVLAQERVR